mmetsp:Transcript_6236/g.15519  ORF Transcript_6236/g.15519 Transcript_6236/m.15519 type:complete len:163 (-) Transcript_6236:354-842(-)
MGFVTAYLWHQVSAKRRRRSYTDRWNIYGPAGLVTVAACLILIDPMRHVLQDAHLISASMYIHNCPIRALQLPERSCDLPSDCGAHHCGGSFYSDEAGTDCFTCWGDGMCSEGAETFGCLTMVGWVTTILCTYVGFALFFVGVLWNSDLVPKISRKWKDLTS